MTGCRPLISMTRSRRYRAVRLAPSFQIVTFALLLVPAAGCDRCFGTDACVDPHVSAQGRLFWHLDEERAEGVRVEFIPEEGVFASSEPVVGFSDENGVFTLELEATGPGEVVGRLSFQPPFPYEHFGFDAGRVRIPTVDVRGDAQELGVWGVGPLPGPPHISYVGELWFADTNELAVGVDVEFRRTGGLAVVPDTFAVFTGENGRFPLLMRPATRGEEGVVIGDIHVRPPAPYQPLVISGVRMETTIAQNHLRLLGIWRIER